jgi:hypothetical protein
MLETSSSDASSSEGGEISMSTDKSTNTPSSKGPLLSLDSWAVIVAVALALAVKFDILKNVPW